jgi:hypothetical protein
MIFHPPRLDGIRATGVLLFSMLLLPCPATAQSALPGDDCRPLAFTAVSEGNVVAKAADFLTQVETVQQHPYWPGAFPE